MFDEIKKISLVIAAYNEEAGIASSLEDIKEYMSEAYPDKEWELIVVDDRSTDRTAEILKVNKKDYPELRIFTHSKNGGQGKGFQTAFRNVTGDVVVTLDADLSYRPKYIGEMLKKMEGTSADIVIASAFLKGGGIENVPFGRRMMTIFANKLLSISSSMNITAATCAVRAYRRSAIDLLPLGTRGMEINLEVVLKAEILGLHIEEVPAVLHWKETKGESTGKKRTKRRNYLNLAKTIAQYSFFSLLFNPNILYFGPQLLLIPVFLSYFLGIMWSIFKLFTLQLSEGEVWNMALSFSLRTTFDNLAHGFYIALASAMMSMFLFLAWFISRQNKFYFEQNHIMLTKILQASRNNRSHDK